MCCLTPVRVLYNTPDKQIKHKFATDHNLRNNVLMLDSNTVTINQFICYNHSFIVLS